MAEYEWGWEIRGKEEWNSNYRYYHVDHDNDIVYVHMPTKDTIFPDPDPEFGVDPNANNQFESKVYGCYTPNSEVGNSPPQRALGGYPNIIGAAQQPYELMGVKDNYKIVFITKEYFEYLTGTEVPVNPEWKFSEEEGSVEGEM